MNKTIKLLTILALTLVLISCKDKGNTQELAVTANQNISKIEVLDFHSTHRCMTCNAIEANTRYTLDTYFSEEMKSGKITFQLINVDKKENEAIAEKFEATGTALFLNVIKDGKETPMDLTEFAFMNGNDKETFSKALKAKLDNALKSL